MQLEDRPEMARILVGLSQIKPGGKITPEALDIWWLAMQGWPIEEFRAAAIHLARSVEFFPSPWHFEQLRKAGGMTAGEAWAIALEHAKGSYRAGPTVPQVERAVAAMGGWQVIARSNLDGLPFLERRFAEHFSEIESREDVREALPAITGPASTWKGRLPGPAPAPVGDLVARLRLKDA
jgi:hypothetical protein